MTTTAAPSAAKAFAIVDAGPRDNILFITGIIACPERKAGRQAVGDAAADIAGHVAGVVIAKSHTRHRFKFLAGLARIDVERTDRGITAVKRALGPPQHFNGLNVHRIAKEGANTRHINAVKEGADAGFNTGVLRRRTDTPDFNGGVTRVVARFDFEVGREIAQFA